jgi:Iap family predicted aminopeptidase
MLTRRATPKLARNPKTAIARALASVSETELRAWVEKLSFPRHFLAEPEENERAALWIAAQLQSWGYSVQLQGRWRNVVALPKKFSGPVILVGAHYDSVECCSGADDNASAVAAMLGCAKACAAQQQLQVGFVSFNREGGVRISCTG